MTVPSSLGNTDHILALYLIKSVVHTEAHSFGPIPKLCGLHWISERSSSLSGENAVEVD
jgi:hypothetical protein